MKTLLLVRHAKSSWDNPDWTDFDRPLNKRGLKNAPAMAEITAKKVKPSIVYASPAKRAITTAQAYCNAFGYPLENIIIDPNIYDKGPKYIIKLVAGTDNSNEIVAVFGHNPDITSLSSYFTGEYIDNVPTCGTICIDFEFDEWKKAENENGSLRFFDYPKKCLKKEE